DGGRQVAPNAARRLKAMEEFTSLGAGFKIALRDLEIRGAGNILGNQQSGHIAAVGYELYCSLLEGAVRQMKQLPPKTPLEKIADVHLEGPGEGTTEPWYLVLGYRNRRKIESMKARDPMVRIVDEKSAYYRLGPAVPEPEELYATIRALLA